MRAADNGLLPLFSDVAVHVYVMRPDDAPPTFHRRDYHVFVPEDSELGQEVSLTSKIFAYLRFCFLKKHYINVLVYILAILSSKIECLHIFENEVVFQMKATRTFIKLLLISFSQGL